MDISGRGYALMDEERFMFWSVEMAEEANLKNFKTLDSLLQIQGYRDPQNYRAVKDGFDRYIQLYEDYDLG